MPNKYEISPISSLSPLKLSSCLSKSHHKAKKSKISHDSDLHISKKSDFKLEDNPIKILSFILILFKIFNVLKKRIKIISKRNKKKGVKINVKNDILIIGTEFAKYSKDLYLKSRILNHNKCVKSFSLITDSFYKSVKIYQKVKAKKSTKWELFCKALKFIPNTIKIILQFSFLMPIEMMVQFSLYNISAILFIYKITGNCSKIFYMTIFSKKERQKQDWRTVLLKIMILICKLIVVFLHFLKMKQMVIYVIGFQIGIYCIDFAVGVFNHLNKNKIELNQKAEKKIINNIGCKKVENTEIKQNKEIMIASLIDYNNKQELIKFNMKQSKIDKKIFVESLKYLKREHSTRICR